MFTAAFGGLKNLVQEGQEIRRVVFQNSDPPDLLFLL